MPETEVERKHSQVRAKEIDEYLQKERKEYLKYKSEPKLLILGSSDSGKSTLLKQLKILHGNGFSDHEKELSRRGIISNIINALALLLNLAEGPFAEEKREVFIIDKEYKTINMVQEEWSPRDTDVPTELIPLLKQAWDEVVVQDAFKNTPHGLPDTTAYFMKDCTKYVTPGYVPTNEDILNLRTVTQTVSDTIFEVKGKKIHFIDVSGLKHHRKSWLSYFDEVSTVLFVASLSSYDQVLVEDPTINRMADAFVLFDQMTNHTLLKKLDFMLFLNKRDLYEKKVKTIPISKSFPEYQGKEGSVSQGVNFFKSKFLAQCKGKNVVVHVTCCTDSKSMEVIIQSVMYL